MADIYIGAGTSPVIKATLHDGNGPINLTGMSVELFIEQDASSGYQFTSTSSGLTIPDPVNGKVEYPINTSLFPMLGNVNIYWRVTEGFRSFDVPSDRYDVIHVQGQAVAT